MRVLILGVDGYIGWALAQHLAAKGHEVSGCDNYARRDWVAEMGSQSATPIARMTARLEGFRSHFKTNLRFYKGDITKYRFVWNLLRSTLPDAIIHLAEMPSAPYSMIDVDHCVYTHQNNVIGNLNLLYAMKEVCPNAHLVKLGSMGEYGTPDIDISEGPLEVTHRGRTAKMMFPRKPGSFYHLTKVHDSHNIEFACRVWGLRSTDIMQGVVYGTRVPAMPDDASMLTRFDTDQAFGTAINRFCAQAVAGEALTVYGTGEQKRGFLPLQDSVQCMGIAIEKPAERGEYRILNQFEETYSIRELAERVCAAGERVAKLGARISYVENPRVEAATHYYNPDHGKLFELGYKPTGDMDGQLDQMLGDLLMFRRRVEARAHAMPPDVRWDGSRRTCEDLVY